MNAAGDRRPTVTDALIAQFAGRKPEREYAAIVAGRVKEPRGTIRSYLQTDKSLNRKSTKHGREGKGELAITHFEVKEHYTGATLLAVSLETGRRNQIRVHCAEMGHPVLGDTRYRTKEAVHPQWPPGRLALHARLLGFSHPVGGKALRFEVELPIAFTEFWRRCRDR